MSAFFDNVVGWMKNHPTETIMIAALVVVFIIGGWVGHVI